MRKLWFCVLRIVHIPPVFKVSLSLVLLVAVLGCGDPIPGQKNRSDEPVKPHKAYQHPASFTANQAAPFVRLALDCAVQEYPNKIGHTMLSDADQGTPRLLHPSFFGCFDWHSSVHGHWLLTRFARLYPEHELAEKARLILDSHLTPENIAAEVEYLMAEGRASWERPYGLAWLLQLSAELHQWADGGSSEAGRWNQALEPLEKASVRRLSQWLPKLAYPIRTGEHSQTAFAFGLMLDYARIAEDSEFGQLIVETSRRLYLNDVSADLRFEPSGQDFLSPVLAEGDLMRRLLKPEEFADWLKKFLPDLPVNGESRWLAIASVTDRSDGKLAHLDGLNLSRAWMLEGMAEGLPAFDARRQALLVAAHEHRQVGLGAITADHYEGGHWLGTYAIYLGSGRGLK